MTEHPMWRDMHPALSPAEERRWRLARYRQLPLAELDRIHLEQSRRLSAGRHEMAPLIARWSVLNSIIDRLELTTQEIEQILIERRGEA